MDRIEAFNGSSHLIGAILAIMGTIALIFTATVEGDGLRLISFLIYGSALSLLYTSSALYHILSGRRKSLFRTLEHQAIYVLIAGTYTPFALVTLRGNIGEWILYAIWGMALLGMTVDLSLKTRRRIIPTMIYLTMGWLIILAQEPLLQALPAVGVQWLLTGGIFYTVGVVFFALSHWYAWAHAVWHLFVLAGSVSHYFTILLYV